MNRGRRALLALGTALGVGAGYPLVDLVLKCGAPTSEACVWGKSLLPLTLGASLLLLGLPAGVLAWWVGGRGSRRGGGPA